MYLFSLLGFGFLALGFVPDTEKIFFVLIKGFVALELLQEKSAMVDLQTVCCMCGDVGFPDKLFRCNKCRNRFQHSYCSNFYSEYAEPIELCDWCRSDQERSTARHGGSSKKSSVVGGVETGGASSRSEYSGDHKIKQHDHQQHRDHQDDGGSGSGEKASKNSGVPSPRPTARRYKLLKDVMC